MTAAELIEKALEALREIDEEIRADIDDTLGLNEPIGTAIRALEEALEEAEERGL